MYESTVRGLSVEACSHIRHHEPLASRTSLRCGGVAEWYCEVGDPDMLRDVLKAASSRGVCTRIIGGCTNLLISEGELNALVIRLAGEFASVRISGTSLHAGAGAWLGAAVAASIRAGLSGIDGLAGIPGTVGGALVGNAGVPGCCIGDSVSSVRVMDQTGTVIELDTASCGFVYRNSALHDFIVLGASLDLASSSSAEVLSKARAAVARRRRIPRGNTAGSVFKNPPGDFAGRLLELAGVKGVSCGGARYSGEHANFIVNDGGSASDVAALIEVGISRVYAKCGVRLEPEIVQWS